MSSISSNGLRRVGPHLLTKADQRQAAWHTLEQLQRLRFDAHLAASRTIRGVGGGEDRYVSSEKSRCPGVSSRLTTWSRYGNWITVRGDGDAALLLSSAIQSDVADRRSPLGLAAPASRPAARRQNGTSRSAWSCRRQGGR